MSEMEEVRIKDELNLVHIKDEVNHMEEENIEDRPDHEAEGFTTIFIKEEFILSDEEVGEDVDEEAIEDPFQLGEGGCSPSRVSNIGISAPAVFDDQETELETYEEHNSSDPLSNNIDLSNAAQNFVCCSYSPRRESNIEISTAAVNVDQERQLETCKEPNTSNKLALTENGWSSALNQYVCKFCEKRFNRNYDLNRHIIIHSKPKPHKCDFCEKSFVHKCLLIIHVRRHTGEKPYNCEFCEKGFSTKSLLKVHMMTHTGEKPHKCKFCDKSFRQKSTLIEHVKTHTGEKPYKCEFCDKRFSQNKVLTCHIRTHTGETPYKCEFCDRSFPSRQHLTYHRKTHTRVKP